MRKHYLSINNLIYYIKKNELKMTADIHDTMLWFYRLHYTPTPEAKTIYGKPPPP